MKQNQITLFSHAFEALFSPAKLKLLGVQTRMTERFRIITPDELCLTLVCTLGAGGLSPKFNATYTAKGLLATAF